jgi:hypothetical protein
MSKRMFLEIDGNQITGTLIFFKSVSLLVNRKMAVQPQSRSNMSFNINVVSG